MGNITLDILLAHKVKELVKERSLMSNDRLPSTRELANKYQVQRITVTEALKRLTNEGCLYCVERKGYFVADNKIEIDLAKEDPLDPLSASVKSFSKCTDASRLPRNTALDMGSDIYEIQKEYFKDKEAIGLEKIFFPKTIFKEYDKQDLERRPLYSYLLSKYGKGKIIRKNELSVPNREFLDTDIQSSLGDGVYIMLKQNIMDSNSATLGYSMTILKGASCIVKNILNREVVK